MSFKYKVIFDPQQSFNRTNQMVKCDMVQSDPHYHKFYTLKGVGKDGHRLEALFPAHIVQSVVFVSEVK